MRLPDYCIIGAMKSGTTTLARAVAAHPQGWLAASKELHFFDRRMDRGLGWYAAQFVDAPPGRVAGEATPNYLHHPAVPDRMHALLPHLRLLVILRDPADRAYSHYWHERERGREDLDFREAVRREPERLAGGDRGDYVHHSYLHRGRYLDQLEPFAARFGRGQLHVLLLEELLADPGATFGAVCDFLGVDRVVPADVRTRANPYVQFRSLAVRRWARRLPGPFGRVVGRLNAHRTTYPPLPDDLRRRLDAHFEEPNGALERWLGRPVRTWWGARDPDPVDAGDA